MKKLYILSGSSEKIESVYSVTSGEVTDSLKNYINKRVLNFISIVRIFVYLHLNLISVQR